MGLQYMLLILLKTLIKNVFFCYDRVQLQEGRVS